MMAKLKLEREINIEKQINDGNRVRRYRCKSCLAAISSQGICKNCEEKAGLFRSLTDRGF